MGQFVEQLSGVLDQVSQQIQVLKGPKTKHVGEDGLMTHIEYSDGTIVPVLRGPDGRATGVQ